MAAPKKIGPSGYGCTQGIAQDIPTGSMAQVLEKVTVWYESGIAGRINAISFTYTEGPWSFDGKPRHHNYRIPIGPWGEPKGERNDFSIDKGVEYLTKLSGTITDDGVASLEFSTSRPATYGPWGKYPAGPDDKPFVIDVDPDCIVAFFGRCDCYYLRSIGAYSGPRA